MNIKEFKTQATAAGYTVAKLTAEQLAILSACKDFEEACAKLSSVLSKKDSSGKRDGAGSKDNPKEIYLANGDIPLALNPKRSMGLTQSGDLVKVATSGLVPQMFELNIIGPTFYRNEDFQNQLHNIMERITKDLHRSINYTENEVKAFIVNNITLDAIYHIKRREYGFSQYVTEDCPNFFKLWNIKYNHNLSSGLYTNLEMNKEMESPDETIPVSESDWCIIDTENILKEIDKKKYWIYAPNNIDKLFEFYFGNVYILDDDYHNRKFSFATATKFDWLTVNPKTGLIENNPIDLNNFTVTDLRDLLNAVGSLPHNVDIRADLSNAEEKGLIVQWSKKPFSILDYNPDDHLLRSKTYVQALINAYTVDANIDKLFNQNFMRIDWIDEEAAGDPYTALLMDGHLATNYENTKTVGFQAINYVMRIFANNEHPVFFHGDIMLSKPSVYVMTSNQVTTASIVAQSSSFSSVGFNTAGDLSASCDNTSYVGKIFADNANYSFVDRDGEHIQCNAFSVINEVPSYFGELITDLGVGSVSEQDKIKTMVAYQLTGQTVASEMWANNSIYLGSTRMITDLYQMLGRDESKMYVYVTIPFFAIMHYANSNIADVNDPLPEPTHVTFFHLTGEYNIYTKKWKTNAFNMISHTFKCDPDPANSYAFVGHLDIDPNKIVIGTRDLLHDFVSSPMVVPADSAMSDCTGGFRTNDPNSVMKQNRYLVNDETDLLTKLQTCAGFVSRNLSGNWTDINTTVGKYTIENLEYSTFTAIMTSFNVDYATASGNCRFSIGLKDYAGRISKMSVNTEEKTSTDVTSSDYGFILSAPSLVRDFPVVEDATGFTTVTFDFEGTSPSGTAGSIDTNSSSASNITIDNTETSLAAWFFVSAGYCIPIIQTEVINVQLYSSSLLVAIATDDAEGGAGKQEGDSQSASDKTLSLVSFSLLKEDFVPVMYNRSELGVAYKDMVSSLTHLVNDDQRLK